MLGLLGRKRRVIGLDIGSSVVKAIEFEERGDGFVITGFATSKVNSPDETRFAVKECVRQGNFRTRNTITSVSGRSVIVRYVSMLQMSKEDLKSAIRYEADKYIPFDVEEVVLDCQVLDQEASKGEGAQPEMKVLLVAVKRSLIDEHLALLDDCGLVPKVIDVDAFALGNAFELRNTNTGRTDYADRVVALIDIGSNKTNINILRGNVSYFTREVYLAGNDFTEAIARRLGIEEAEAEGLKNDPQDRASEIEECILPTLDDLSNEIQLSFDYFENQFDREVEEVYISGGSAKLPGLPRAFEGTLDKPIIRWDPLENQSVASSGVDIQQMEKNSSQLAIVLGLASRVRSL